MDNLHQQINSLSQQLRSQNKQISNILSFFDLHGKISQFKPEQKRSQAQRNKTNEALLQTTKIGHQFTQSSQLSQEESNEILSPKYGTVKKYSRPKSSSSKSNFLKPFKRKESKKDLQISRSIKNSLEIYQMPKHPQVSKSLQKNKKMRTKNKSKSQISLRSIGSSRKRYNQSKSKILSQKIINNSSQINLTLKVRSQFIGIKKNNRLKL